MNDLINFIVGDSIAITDPEFVARLVIFALVIHFLGLIINYLGGLTR